MNPNDNNQRYLNLLESAQISIGIAESLFNSGNHFQLEKEVPGLIELAYRLAEIANINSGSLLYSDHFHILEEPTILFLRLTKTISLILFQRKRMETLSRLSMLSYSASVRLNFVTEAARHACNLAELALLNNHFAEVNKWLYRADKANHVLNDQEILLSIQNLKQQLETKLKAEYQLVNSISY